MSVDKNIEVKQHHLIPCSSIEQINQQPPLSVSHASKPSKHTGSTQYQYLLFALSPVKCQTACQVSNGSDYDLQAQYRITFRALPDARAHWLTLIMAMCVPTNSASGSDSRMRGGVPPARPHVFALSL